MIVASITATAIIHLFEAAGLCCGGEELCEGAAAMVDLDRHTNWAERERIPRPHFSATVGESVNDCTTVMSLPKIPTLMQTSEKSQEAPAPRQLGGQTFATSGDQCCDVQVAEATGASGSSCM
jgi:hypothetical protein